MRNITENMVFAAAFIYIMNDLGWLFGLAVFGAFYVWEQWRNNQ